MFVLFLSASWSCLSEIGGTTINTAGKKIKIKNKTHSYNAAAVLANDWPVVICIHFVIRISIL